jgi:hypothetical protein
MHQATTGFNASLSIKKIGIDFESLLKSGS